MLLVCKPIGRSGQFVFCSASHMKLQGPKTDEHLFRLGMDGSGSHTSVLDHQSKAGTTRQPAAALGEQGQQGQQGQQESRDRESKEQPTQEQSLRSTAARSTRNTSTVQYCMNMNWSQCPTLHHSPPLPRPPPVRPRVIINNSAYDSYPTARIARMACMASAADPDPRDLVRARARQATSPAQHQPGRSTQGLCW